MTDYIDRARSLVKRLPVNVDWADADAAWQADACVLIAEMATRIVVLEKLCRTGKGWPVTDE